MQGKRCWPWLAVGLLYMVGCTTLSVQSVPSAPYAVLEFPASIQLLALDDQAVDTRTRRTTRRVNPGPHVLQLMYAAVGSDGSNAHDGQHAAPFTLEVREGFAYHFVAKT